MTNGRDKAGQFSRRAALTGLALFGAGCANSTASLPFVSRASAGELPDLSSPQANLRHILRMSASLEQEDCPWWYNGTVYGIVGETQPVPFFHVEGMEIYRVTPLGEGDYEMTGNTVSFFKDPASGVVLTEFENPVTGKTVPVKPAVQGGGPGRGYNYSVKGIRPTVLKDQMPDSPPNFEWSSAGGKVWVHSSRVYPPGMTTPRAERQTAFAQLDEFNDESVAKINSSFTSTFFAPWLKWLEMGDAPGHMVWHAGGAKLASIDDLPTDFRTRVERDYPERLTGKPEAGTGGKKVE